MGEIVENFLGDELKGKELGDEVLEIASMQNFSDLFLPKDITSAIARDNAVKDLLGNKSEEELIAVSKYLSSLKEDSEWVYSVARGETTQRNAGEEIDICDIALNFLAKYLPQKDQNPASSSEDNAGYSFLGE